MIRFLAKITGLEKKIRDEEKKNFELILQNFRQCFYSKEIQHRKHVWFCIDKMYSDLKKDIRPNGLNTRDYVDEKVKSKA